MCVCVCSFVPIGAYLHYKGCNWTNIDVFSFDKFPVVILHKSGRRCHGL